MQVFNEIIGKFTNLVLEKTLSIRASLNIASTVEDNITWISWTFYFFPSLTFTRITDNIHFRNYVVNFNWLLFSGEIWYLINENHEEKWKPVKVDVDKSDSMKRAAQALKTYEINCAQEIKLTNELYPNKKMNYTKIENIYQYHAYCDILEELLDTKGESGATMVLEELILEWDKTHSTFKKLNPMETLHSLMTDNKLSNTDIALILGTKPNVVEDILNGRRKLSLMWGCKLATHFKTQLDAFIKPKDK